MPGHHDYDEEYEAWPDYHDPYRARSGQAPSDPHNMTEHSRTASDSSTARLTAGLMTTTPARYPDDSSSSYDTRDPYAALATSHKPRSKPAYDQSRAHSYLPYSNHTRRSLEQPEFTDSEVPKNVGSMLHDMPTDTMDTHHAFNHPLGMSEHPSPLPIPTKKKRRRRCCGIPCRIAVYLAFAFITIVVVVWYFVWPRTPVLLYNSVNLISDSSNWSANPLGMSAIWNVSFNVDNTQNWVPTHISNLAVTVIDDGTQVTIGSGNTGQLVIPPRQTSILVFNASISYAPAQNNAADDTWNDISSACGAQLQNPTPSQLPPSLNIDFRVTYHIAGIVWTSIADVRPLSGFTCPTS